MKQKIHYENDIFYLKMYIRILSDALKLNIDSFIFAEKTLDDINFVESIIQKMYNSLIENPHLIRRADHLLSILEVKKFFITYLETLTRSGNPYSNDLKQAFPKLRRSVANHTRDLSVIQDQLKSTEKISKETEHISENEMSFLLTPYMDNDE
ncbi:MAG: hypothetical protein PF518_01325 [Spirochaetaceae bacterium]|jgi:hypothetical protein|nr:hypothetical protein [Spirochaetaceae bacterium]